MALSGEFSLTISMLIRGNSMAAAPEFELIHGKTKILNFCVSHFCPLSLLTLSAIAKVSKKFRSFVIYTALALTKTNLCK